MYNKKDFLLLYFLFPFYLAPIYLFQKILYYTLVLYSLYIIIIKIRKASLPKKDTNYLLCFFIMFSLLICLTFVIPTLYETYDNSYFSRLIDYFIRFLVISIACLLCNDVKDFFITFSKATSLYVLITTVLLIPPIRNWYTAMLSNTGDSRAHAKFLLSQGLLYYTRFGLQGFSGFEHTFRCSLAFQFLIYLLLENKNKKDRKQLYYLLTLNFLGCCYYGRIGIISCFMTLIIYTLYLIVIRKQYKVILYIILFGGICFFVFLAMINFIKKVPYLSWMFEPFINFVEKGKLSSASSDGLKTMYIKISQDTFLFGDGYYQPKGSYYRGTDVGFLRPLLFWGIWGSIIYYSCFLIILIPIYNYLIKYNKKTAGFFVLILLLQNLLYELKGEINLAFINILLGVDYLLIYKNCTRIKFSQIIKGLKCKNI